MTLAPPSHDPALPQEVELTLAGPAPVLKQVFTKGPPAGLHAAPAPPARRLESVYFDTPDHDLQRAGLGLRVRKVGRRFIQTLKTAESDALLARGEWEVAVPGATADPAAFADPLARALLMPLLQPVGLTPPPLNPVFATRVRRRMRVLTDTTSGARIELALDDGVLETPTGSRPIAELELELIDGDRRAVWRAATALAEAAGLAPEWQSKAARGYTLASGKPPPVSRRKSPGLVAGQSVEQAMAAILATCYRQWADNLAAAIDGRDPEGVHQLRVALRRMRSALSVFRSVLPPADLEWLRRDLSWVADELGPARDWDVFAAETLAPMAEAIGDDEGLQRLARTVEAARQAGYQRVRTALTGARHGQVMLQIGQWLDTAGWRAAPAAAANDPPAEAEAVAVPPADPAQPVDAFAGHILNRRHRRALKAGRRLSTASPAVRHRLRIQVKKLRYAAEFFGSLYRAKPVKAYLKAAARLQDRLGRLNDLAVAEARLQHLVDDQARAKERTRLALAAGRVLGWHHHLAVEELGDLDKAWRTFTETAALPAGRGAKAKRKAGR